jgi:PilZ domain
MPMFGKRIDGVDGRRSAIREPMLLSAAILTLNRSFSAIIVDVSATGARLGGCREVSQGDDLWIKVGVIDALATVVWAEEGQCGVTFDAALSDADLDHLRKEAKNTLVTRLTPQERLAAQGWIAALTR